MRCRRSRRRAAAVTGRLSTGTGASSSGHSHAPSCATWSICTSRPSTGGEISVEYVCVCAASVWPLELGFCASSVCVSASTARTSAVWVWALDMCTTCWVERAKSCSRHFRNPTKASRLRTARRTIEQRAANKAARPESSRTLMPRRAFARRTAMASSHAHTQTLAPAAQGGGVARSELPSRARRPTPRLTRGPRAACSTVRS